jgi:hypothetical protein
MSVRYDINLVDFDVLSHDVYNWLNFIQVKEDVKLVGFDYKVSFLINYS